MSQSLHNRITVAILQHPQEAREPLGSGKLTADSLSRSIYRVGLSWRSLSAAIGAPAQPRDWAVLFLGSTKSRLENGEKCQIQFRGKPLVGDPKIKGILILDGNWKQSKTLWWRNPWLLKLPRVVLAPSLPSRYGKLRRAPRKECLSTLEATAETLKYLGEPSDVTEGLIQRFEAFLSEKSVPVRVPQPIHPA